MKIESNRSILRDVIDFLHKNIIVVIVCFVLFSGSLAALFIYLDQDTDDNEDENTQFKATDTLYFSIKKPQDMNILTSDEEDVNQMWHLLYSSLFYFNRDLSVSPELVKEYKTDAKNGTVSITINEKAKFSDGKQITSTDVADSIEYIKNIGESGPFYLYANKIENVEIKDDLKAAIHFETPSDASLTNLVFPIISSDSYDKNDKSYNQVSSGKFMIKSFSENKIELVPNSGYYGEQSKNNINFSFSTKGEDTKGLITIGSITGKFSKLNNSKTEAENMKLNFKPMQSPKMEYIGFNFRNEFLKKKTLRKSIVGSINFDELVDDYFADLGLHNSSIYYPGFLDVKKQNIIGYSPSKSSILLKKAGYKRSEEKDVLVDPKGREVNLKLLINESSQIRNSMAEDIKIFLEKINIKVEIERVPDDEYFTRIEKGDFDMYIGGFDFDPRYDMRKLFDKSGSIGYSNEDVISLVNKMEFCLQPEDRRTNYQKLYKKLSDDVPFYCIGYYKYGFVSGGRWNKSPNPTFFNPYYNCESWEWEKPDSIKDKSNLRKQK